MEEVQKRIEQVRVRFQEFKGNLPIQPPGGLASRSTPIIPQLLKGRQGLQITKNMPIVNEVKSKGVIPVLKSRATRFRGQKGILGSRSSFRAITGPPVGRVPTPERRAPPIVEDRLPRPVDGRDISIEL